jgi:hypothetical protein
MIGWQKGGFSLESAATAKSYFVDSTSEFKNNLVHAIAAPYRTGDAAAAGIIASADLIKSKAESQGCITLASGDSALLTAPYYSTSPKFLPQTGSRALTGASFTGMNSYFTTGAFRGAMGTTDWTANWTNWDPQNKAY